MNELVAQTDVEVSSMTTEELKAELARGLTMTAAILSKLARIWDELERRGEDLSELRYGVARLLPLIASGRLASEAVVAFAGRPLILRCLEGVPLDEQRKLADGMPIPVYLPGSDEPQSLPLVRIPSVAVTRVICDGSVRTPAEQRLAMRKREKKTEENKEQRRGTITVEKEERTIRIGRYTVPLASVIAALAEAAGAKGEVFDSVEMPAKTIAGKVTDEEKERLKAAAKAHGMEEWEMVRQAVVAMWLL